MTGSLHQGVEIEQVFVGLGGGSLKSTDRVGRPRLVLTVALALISSTLAGSLLVPTPAEATSIVDFDVAFSENLNGSIGIFGNNLMVCPGTGSNCTGARAGTNSRNNNSFVMTHLDQDGAAFSTFSSSSADVNLPDGAEEVEWAGLYWGARLEAGTDGDDADGDGQEMSFRAPGDTAYQTISADVFFGPSDTDDEAYQGFAEVTEIVRDGLDESAAQDIEPTFWGADVPAATGEDRYAGWALVVVYSGSMPLRNLTVFHGLADIGRNDPQTITISGFTTPVDDGELVNARIGLVAYEGDRGSSGDQAIFEGTQLATPLSPGTNFFNGTNDDNGTLVTDRSPDDVNMLGFDIKNFDAPGLLDHEATSAQIDLESTSERFLPGVVTTAIDVFGPDFSSSTKTVTNLTGGDPARVGDTLRYTVTFVNDGQDPAINTSIVDPIPAGTMFAPGSLDLPAGVTGGFNPVTNRLELSPGDFPIGRSVTYTFDVLLGPGAANTSVSNQATITFDGETVDELQDLQFTTGAASTTVVPSADLSITKVNTPASVVAGNTLTSTITVSNSGPSAAAGVVVTDELPPGLGTVTASSTQGTCTVASGVVMCNIGAVAAGAIVTITVNAAVPPGSTVASLTDIARVVSPTDDPDPGDNTIGETSDVTRNANLSVTKTVAPATVTPGNPVTYTVVATNNGPSTATSVVIDDSVDNPAVTLLAASVPGGTCTTEVSSARCTIGSLAPGASVTMTVQAVARPDATPGVVANQAAASSATPDADDTDNTTVQQVTVGPAVSTLDVTKTADAPSPLVAGVGEVRYTVTVSNEGPSDANPVTVTDDLPDGFVAISATTDRGECQIAADGGSVSCDIGRLLAPFAGDPGASASITIVAEVPSTVAAGSYSNSATASAPSADPATSPAAPVTVEALANVSVIKTLPDGADPVVTPGLPITYRIRVVNEGPSVASNVVVEDLPQAGLTDPVWTAPAGVTCAALSCSLGDLASGDIVELELELLVDPGIDVTLGVTNTAEATSPTDDPNEGDNTSVFTLAGVARADFSIRKLAPDEAPVAGDTTPGSLASRTFEFEITNFGPSAATGITFTDELPEGVTFVRVYDIANPDFDLAGFLDCTAVGTPQTVTCAFDPTVEFPASFGIAGLGMEVHVDQTVPDGTLLENSVSVSSAVTDGNPGNNTATVLVPVRAEVNLTVEKLVVEMDNNGNFITNPPIPHPEALDPLGVPPGHALSFGVLVTNEGPSAALDVQLIDAFPLDAAYFPIGDCEFLNGESVCDYNNPATGDMLLSGQQFFVQVATVLDGNTPPGIYTNTASTSTSTEETTLDDNIDSRPIEVVEPLADLIIEKAATTSPFVAGETFTYQLAVSSGRIDLPTQTIRLSSDAENAVVTDTLPAGLIPLAATPSQGTCTISDQDVICDLGTLEASIDLVNAVPPALITVTGTVAPGFTGDSAVNTAVATSTTPLRGGGESVEATAMTTVERSADLTLTKVADAATAPAGGGTTFTVIVTNTGPSDATNVEVTDLLPAPLEFSPDGSDPACSLVGENVVCDIGTITAGEARALTIAATLPPDAQPASITNTASVTSDVDDPNDADNTASTDVEVFQSADLAVTKAPAAEGVLLGDAMTYTLTVVNEGPSNATGVVLTESIPSGTVVATLPSGCSGSGPIECDIGNLAAGDAVVLELVLEVPDTLPPGPLDNTAEVDSDIDDADSSDNVAVATVEAIALADVTVEKVVVTENPIAGQPVEFQLILTNNGPTVAPNASLSDPIPVGATFVSLAASQGTCQLDPLEGFPAASCNLGRMEVGATATATLTVDTDPNATIITNTGYAGSGGLDELALDNEATATASLTRIADLSVSKTGSAEVSAAAPAEYVISFHNDGPATATNVSVTDTLPAGMTPRPVDGCTISGNTVTCEIATLAAGTTGSVTVQADVDPALPLGTELTNSAGIVSDVEGLTDPDLADNTATFTSVVEALNDVGVTVTAIQTEVPPGAIISYEVVVTNNGPQVASGVVLTNQLPPEVLPEEAFGQPGIDSFALQAVVPSECSASGPTMTCNLGALGVGQSRSYVFGGNISTSTPVGTELIDTATVVYDGTDSVSANNSDSDSILVVGLADPPPVDDLPFTGADLARLFVLAVALVAAGFGVRFLASRWNRRWD